jgi:hypothetical protein
MALVASFCNYPFDIAQGSELIPKALGDAL